MSLETASSRVFSVPPGVTTLDWLHASFLAASNQLVTYPTGGNGYIINYYVPAIGVVHVLIFAFLLKESHALETLTAIVSR